MTNSAIGRIATLVIILGAFAQPVFAQNAVGGPKKQIAVGGAAKQTSPVVPANKGGAPAGSSPTKCPTGTCVVKGAK